MSLANHHPRTPGLPGRGWSLPSRTLYFRSVTIAKEKSIHTDYPVPSLIAQCLPWDGISENAGWNPNFFRLGVPGRVPILQMQKLRSGEGVVALRSTDARTQAQGLMHCCPHLPTVLLGRSHSPQSTVSGCQGIAHDEGNTDSQDTATFPQCLGIRCHDNQTVRRLNASCRGASLYLEPGPSEELSLKAFEHFCNQGKELTVTQACPPQPAEGAILSSCKTCLLFRSGGIVPESSFLPLENGFDDKSCEAPKGPR